MASSAPAADPGSDTFLLSSIVSVGTHGFPVSHPYLEVIYGPLVGPTAVLLARNLDRRLADEPQPVTVSATSLARELGLRAGPAQPLGKRSHLHQAIDRLAYIRVVAWLAPHHLGLSTVVMPASDRTLAKVPELAITSHHRYMTASRADDGPHDDRPNG